MKTQRLTIKLHLAPTPDQGAILCKMGFGVTKLWNSVLYHTRKLREETGKIPSDVECQKEFQGSYWYTSQHSDTAIAVVQQVWRAYKSWFKLRQSDPTAKPPGFRTKNAISAIPSKRRGFEIYPEGTAGTLRLSVGKGLAVHLTKIGQDGLDSDGFLRVSYQTYRPIPADAKLCYMTVVGKQDTGRWTANLVIEVRVPDSKLPSDGKMMAIDRGVRNLATTVTDDGETTIYAVRDLNAEIRRWNKRQQRRQRQRQRTLNNYAKKRGLEPQPFKGQSRPERREQRKHNRRRRQMLHVVSKAIVVDALNKGCVGIVDGDLKGLKKGGDGKRRKDISKASRQKINKMPMAELGTQIRYKAALAGLFYERVSEYGTSKTCSLCGTTNGNCRVHRGLYMCPECESILNADVNGAHGILLRFRGKYPRPQSVEGVEALLTAPSVARLAGLTQGILVSSQLQPPIPAR